VVITEVLGFMVSSSEHVWHNVNMSTIHTCPQVIGGLNFSHRFIQNPVH